ncbi:MAG: DUF4406 domain-containing protein [Micropruina sp.]
MITRSELQRLHGRAVGGARRYWCDGLVQDLLTALGEYLEQPDETVEIAYLKTTIADLRNDRDPARGEPLRLYIAGPMTGIEDYNFPAFHRSADVLRQAGYRVENPAETGVRDGWEWPDYMRSAVARLVRCDGVALLTGWESSHGARLEHYIATNLGMRVRTVQRWFEEGALA